jgi:hypothetical protein
MALTRLYWIEEYSIDFFRVQMNLMTCWRGRQRVEGLCQERFGLVQIFTQSRRAAEMLIGKSDYILRDEIFGGPFYA